MLKSAFGGLSTGVCRQPQWAYVGGFMYSLAGWSRFYGILFPAVYVPACADSRSGLMSGGMYSLAGWSYEGGLRG